MNLIVGEQTNKNALEETNHTQSTFKNIDDFLFN